MALTNMHIKDRILSILKTNPGLTKAGIIELVLDDGHGAVNERSVANMFSESESKGWMKCVKGRWYGMQYQGYPQKKPSDPGWQVRIFNAFSKSPVPILTRDRIQNLIRDDEWPRVKRSTVRNWIWNMKEDGKLTETDGGLLMPVDYEPESSGASGIIDDACAQKKVGDMTDAELEAEMKRRRIARNKDRIDEINKRMEIIDAHLVAFLNLDEVIRIVRFEDEPKLELMKAFKLTSAQGDAILNTRIRCLHKLEEPELRDEHKRLNEELKSLTG